MVIFSFKMCQTLQQKKNGDGTYYKSDICRMILVEVKWC